MKLFVGISELVQPHAREGESRTPLDLTLDAALLVEEGMLVAAGERRDVEQQADANAERIDLGGRAVIPGLVDSHSHLLFAGDRIDEFSRRARGETYEQIAEAGGGIVRSTEPLRAASIEELVEKSKPRLDLMLSHGTTTCEIKSGYGMSVESELKQLQAIRALGESTPVCILPTLLAHVVPPENREDRSAYIATFIGAILNIAAADQLARFCDIFVEEGAFTTDEARQIAKAAREAGLGIKLHVDQLRDGGGALLAAELGALSADHLEFVNAEGRARLAEAKVVATLLPGCALFLGNAPWPNGRALRDVGCEVAVATDCNPGSSMITNLALCATLAATQLGLSLEEALWAVTRGGARALGLDDRGRLQPKERADFIVVANKDWRALLYRPTDPPIDRVVIGGSMVPGLQQLTLAPP